MKLRSARTHGFQCNNHIYRNRHSMKCISGAHNGNSETCYLSNRKDVLTWIDHTAAKIKCYFFKFFTFESDDGYTKSPQSSGSAVAIQINKAGPCWKLRNNLIFDKGITFYSYIHTTATSRHWSKLRVTLPWKVPAGAFSIDSNTWQGFARC